MSSDVPRFPAFKPLELQDRDIIHAILCDYQPETSELTFTNLFIWQGHYHFAWALADGCLLLVGETPAGVRWALPPVGPGPRAPVCRELLAWLQEKTGQELPAIERADARLADELRTSGGFLVTPQREQFDYVYRTADLIKLGGRKYHDKRNHLNGFLRTYRHTYEPFREEHRRCCLDLTHRWCQWRRCQDDLNLMDEWDAVKTALHSVTELGLTGGVILIAGKVEAFALGEKLNQDTAVVHLEKANPEIRGLYTAINQQFCEQAWSAAEFINREQDLGEPGLRKAKLSYNPERLVEKFRIQLA